jgi:hypothetical protein
MENNPKYAERKKLKIDIYKKYDFKRASKFNKT